jgi:hypothetical protein
LDPDRNSLQKPIGVYVETTNYADLFLTSLKNFEEKHLKNPEKKLITWKMRPKDLEAYGRDSQVMHLRLNFGCEQWFG